MKPVADGKAVWSWHPDAGVKFCGSNLARRWWLTSPVHQGDHGVTVKTIAQGMPGDLGEPVVTTLVCSTLPTAYEAAGASSIRHSLRPLFAKGAKNFSKTRAHCVAGLFSAV